MKFVLLKELSLAQQHCKIRTRVSRIWESTTPLLKNDILSLDCLLIDEEVVMNFILAKLAVNRNYFLLFHCK